MTYYTTHLNPSVLYEPRESLDEWRMIFKNLETGHLEVHFYTDMEKHKMAEKLYKSTKFTGVYELVSSTTEANPRSGVFRSMETRELYICPWKFMTEITQEKNYVLVNPADKTSREVTRFYEWPSQDLPEVGSLWFTGDARGFVVIEAINPERPLSSRPCVFHGKKVSFDEEV